MNIYKNYIIPGKLTGEYLIQTWSKRDTPTCLEISHNEFDYALKYLALRGVEGIILWNIKNGTIDKKELVTLENIKQIATDLYVKNDI